MTSRTPNKDGIFSSKGAAEILTPLSESFSIKFGSLGEYVENDLPFEKYLLYYFLEFQLLKLLSIFY